MYHEPSFVLSPSLPFRMPALPFPITGPPIPDSHAFIPRLAGKGVMGKGLMLVRTFTPARGGRFSTRSGVRRGKPPPLDRGPRGKPLPPERVPRGMGRRAIRKLGHRMRATNGRRIWVPGCSSTEICLPPSRKEHCRMNRGSTASLHRLSISWSTAYGRSIACRPISGSAPWTASKLSSV